MKILIVEDEQNFRNLIRESIEKWGLETVSIEDFTQIFSIFLKERPHLVLLDINLPLYDGFYWCWKIREVSQVPIIFISSRNTPMDSIMAMNMGGDDFIQKPFHLDVLMAKINALLRRTYSYVEIQPDVLEHDGVVLNLKDGDMYIGEESSKLTKTEFIILRLLLQQKGTIVARTKIMRELWKDESFIDDNTLTVNITRLRKKLADIGKKDFIQTKKGQGYLIP
ncbi:response regulator transcription factor [Shimazuella alba]|uniref:Response regulator n=1 Tax=Shimazuella alba TaxID=2690964 RepID=A0A6I4VSR0_9BACL|nr:response regulator transcription factor [Shimazuella alba]MXQ53471.1 response regulator [Shimazuella alba]